MNARMRRRWARQIQLGEVGEAGQARIAAATARVPTEDVLTSLVARAYAERAGFGAIVAGPSEDVPAFVEHPAARAVIAGSLAALREIRVALSPEPK